MDEFKIGDVVYLKSEPQRRFTVCEVFGDGIRVTFFDNVNQQFAYSARLDKRLFKLWIDI